MNQTDHLNPKNHSSDRCANPLIILVLCAFIPQLIFAQHDPIAAGVYEWKKPSALQGKVKSSILFEGSATDMEYLQMNACSIAGGKVIEFRAPENEERLLIVRSGVLVLQLNDSSFTVSKGSVALILPGDRYSLRPKVSYQCQYYLMKYRSKNPVDRARGKNSGGSFVKKWEDIPFKPHDKGGIRNFFQRPTAMTRRFEMHVTTLNEGLRSHDPHRHHAEEIIVVIDSKTEMQIDDKLIKAKTGDVIFLASNVSHAIRNDGKGPCTYFAFQFE